MILRRIVRLAGLASLALAPAVAAAQPLGLEVFTKLATPPCAVCHTLAAAGATGEIGPSLDELKPDRTRVLEAVRTGVGVMPRFTGILTEEQIQAVADFVVKSTQGK